MASELGYITAAKLRVDAGLDTDDTSNWNDSELDVIITKSEHMAHILGKRPTSNPWTAAEDIYEIVQRFVSVDARKLMFSGMSEYKDEFDNAESDRAELIPLIVSPDQGAEGYGAKSSGANNDKTQSSETTGTFT